jgi:hypothetical protein
VYVGLATTSGGFNIGGNGIKAKLSDEPVFRRMANNLALLPNRRAVIQECFVTVAELKGQSLEIAPMPGLPATVCYVKLVPMTDAEVAASQAKSKHRTSIATFDGHSWIWPFKPTTAEELAEEFRGYEGTDIGNGGSRSQAAIWCATRARSAPIPAKAPLISPPVRIRSIRSRWRRCSRRASTRSRSRVMPRRLKGAEFHVMLRPAGWVGSMPYEETFNSKFFYQHPEWRCIDRDGTPTFYMSYANPEVRRH